MADRMKLTLAFWNSSEGIFRILLIVDPIPDMQNKREQIKQIDVAADDCSIVGTHIARSLAADRAISFLPSFHNDIAYICKPSASSEPKYPTHIESMQTTISYDKTQTSGKVLMSAMNKVCM